MSEIKSLAILLAIGAAMASCSSEEELGTSRGQQIEFRAAVGRGTRASETTIANLGNFSVTAIGADGSEYFTDVYSRSDASWIPSTQHYWPTDNSELRFFAWAPATPAPSASISITSSEQKITDFSPAGEMKDQQDFIVAFAEGRKSVQGATGVQLTFRHALSQIEIRAKNAGAVYTYKVTGVKIGSVASKGAFTFPTAAGTDGAWTTGTDRADYSVEYPDAPLTLGSEPVSLMTAESGTAMLIPQQLTPWDFAADPTNSAGGAYLAVKINVIAQVDNNQMFPAENGGYGWACIPVDTRWQPGYKYVYTLDFTNGAGKTSPDDPDNPGDDILTDPIRFTVDVEPWINDDGDHNLSM